MYRVWFLAKPSKLGYLRLGYRSRLSVSMYFRLRPTIVISFLFSESPDPIILEALGRKKFCYLDESSYLQTCREIAKSKNLVMSVYGPTV